MLLRLREIIDPDLQLSPALRAELRDADRAHNHAIGRRWWALAVLAQELVVFGVARTHADSAPETR